MQSINGWQWEEYDEVVSTNDTVRNLTNKKDGAKYVVTALRQTGGRGRRGRSWVSLEGNLFMSMAFEAELKNVGQIVFIVSLSLLETLRHLFPDINICLKWPNDVLVNDRKISGILLEKGEGDYIIAGIGVNIAAAPKIDGLVYPAQSLADFGFETGRLDLFRAYLQTFEANYKLWQEQGFETIRARWLANAKNLGKEILVRMNNEERSGIFAGVDENGTLLLERNNNLEKIYAGDIFCL